MSNRKIRTCWYFKLFNSIKEPHEVDFAELEMSSLFGKVERIRNFTDILFETPFHSFIKETRIQDYLAHELPYGKCEGFYGERDGGVDVGRLVRRLAYTREFYMVTEGESSPEEVLRRVFPTGGNGKNVQFFQEDGKMLFRFIVNQYFLEKTQYISKLSRDEREVDINVEILFDFLTKRLERIPASSTMQVGKRLEDYFATREEPSLHLTHYMHPYKGKFHPKMVRALLNYIYPEVTGTVMDNFAGCGTLLVEATLMSLNSIGVEINPLSVLMSNAKCHSLSIEPESLKKKTMDFLQNLKTAQLSYEKQASGTMLLVAPKYDTELLVRRRGAVPKKVVEMFDSGVIEKFLIAHQLINQIDDPKIRDFLLLGLSGTISDMVRRKSGEFTDILGDRLMNLYLRIYIFHRLNEVLGIKLGGSETFVCDTRDMKSSCRRLDGSRGTIGDGEVKAIVNSPPYSTALDYIRNDYPQLTILNLADIESLEEDMVGNPSFKVYPDSLLLEIKDEIQDYVVMPKDAKTVINALLQDGRKKEALRTYRFFKDMRRTLREMHRVLGAGCKAAIIIGNNHYKIDGEYIEVKNDEVIEQLGLEIGFRQDKKITRELEKSRTGMIRYETILILQKPTNLTPL